MRGGSNSSVGGVAEVNPDPPPLMIVTEVTRPADTFARPTVTIPEEPIALTRILV